MKKNLEEQVLKLFLTGLTKFPTFKNEKEKKIFLQLQKYNLIYVTPEGVFVISTRGKEALEFGVEKFLILERFEERLVKDSLKREIERKWLFFAVIPLVFLMAVGILLLQLEIL